MEIVRDRRVGNNRCEMEKDRQRERINRGSGRTEGKKKKCV